MSANDERWLAGAVTPLQSARRGRESAGPGATVGSQVSFSPNLIQLVPQGLRIQEIVLDQNHELDEVADASHRESTWWSARSILRAARASTCSARVRRERMDMRPAWRASSMSRASWS